MATTPPVPDATKFQGILVLADKIPQFTRELIDAIKKPTGNAVVKYKDLHTFVLALKDQCNGLYKAASAADASLQTGKRKDKAPKEDAPVKVSPKDGAPKPEKKETRAERKEKRRAARASERGASEPEVSGQTSDDP